MYFKGWFVFLLVSVCLCLLRWNNYSLTVLFLPFVIQMIIKRSLLSTLNASKNQLTILLSHFLPI